MDSPEKLNGFLTTSNGGPGSIRSKSKKELCTACQQPIIDRYIMRVMDNSWHEGCLTCAVCRMHLSRTCYSRDRKLYCKADYDKLFAVKCTGCVLPIAPTELVMRALDHVYHLPCFVCVGCGRQLQKGDQFVVRGGRLYCRPDFEKEMQVMQIVTRGENGQLTSTPHNGQPRQDGRRGPKRPRTILTTAQRRAFKASFEISQKPCRKVRESLAKETGLSVRIVQVWFQNQRAKLKKLQRKQQQQMQQQSQKQNADGQQNGGSNADLSSPGKDGKKSDDLSHGDPGDYSPPYARLSVGDSDPSQFPLPPVPFGSQGSEGQYYTSSHPDSQYMKSDISMDSEGSLGGLEDVLISQGQTTTLSDGGHIFPSSVNPIDKLYSMQTSYFSSNECECLGATN